VVVSQIAGADGPAPPHWRGARAVGFAVLTVDAAGLVTSWSVTAARLFGRAAGEMTGQHLGDALLNRPGQRELLREALAEVSAGRPWTAPVDVAFAHPDGLATMHCEPAPGGSPAGPGGALVIIQRAPAAPARTGPDLLSEAATRIGTTLDLTRTAREVTEVAVPAFAAAATIFVSEPLLAADDVAARRAAPAAVVRRLAARLAGQPAAVTDSVLRPGEVLVFDGTSPSFRAMSTGQPVRSGHLGRETVEGLTRRPGGHQIAAGYTTFLAVPLAARGLVLGCATFARAPGDPGFEPDDIALAAELATRAAVCIDNARLYDRERRTAFALQHGLLPREPRHPPPVLAGGAGPAGARPTAGTPARPRHRVLRGDGSEPAPEDHPRPVHRRPGGSRTRPLDEGLTALGTALGLALAPPGGPLDTGCEMVTQALRQRGDDDITLVLAWIRPGVSGSR
jgi:hypothetical protein